MTSETNWLRRPIPLKVIILIALAVHGPLLIMGLPARTSYDANFHIFFASHYANHWFNPWNEKWFTGFSQTTYPPLVHQWIALLSYVVGLTEAYMLVQLIAILLLCVGVYQFARLWVDQRAASYAALFSVFAGVVSFLVYSAGQLPTMMSAPLYLLAVPSFYRWSRSGKWQSLVKGVVLTIAAGCAHHVTLLFGSIFFATPVLWLAAKDSRSQGRSAGGTVARGVFFVALALAGLGVVLAPYWIAIIRHPIEQMPIPHASRSNFLMNLTVLTNYFLIPYGAMLLVLPFIVFRGASVPRLRPLLIAFWVAFLFGLGGTTPVPRWTLGRAFEILTFERFTLWATLLALPLVGLCAEDWIDRFRDKAAVGLSLAAITTMALAMGWLYWSPYRPSSDLKVSSVIEFLNRDGHDRYRYLTLGFGTALPTVSTGSNASSVDGEYNSARLLPEMTRYGAAQLTNAKFYGAAGMASLRSMLAHADRYGLKFIFVHDPFYDPLLVFAGWRHVETFDSGAITVWSKDDVPPARKIHSDAVPTPWQGLLWGILPIGSSVLAILLFVLMPERRSTGVKVVPLTSPERETIYAHEARS
jgi:hypothetical protein